MGRLQKARASGAPSLYLQLGVVLCIIKEGWEGTCGTWLLHPFTSKPCREACGLHAGETRSPGAF